METSLPISTPMCEGARVAAPSTAPRTYAGERSYCQATLAEHERMRMRLQRNGNAFEDEVLRFLGVADCETVIASVKYPAYELPQIHRALRACFADWSIVQEGGGDGYHGHLWAPNYRRIQTRPGRRRNYLFHGTRFYVRPDARRRVVLFEINDNGQGEVVELSMIAPRREQIELNDEMRRLQRRVGRNHYLRRQAIDAAGRLLGGRQRADWDDLIVDAKLAESLERQVLDFLRLGETFRRNGVPHRRGLLLYGPPGNGKTTIGRVLAGMGRTTFVYVTAADVGGCPLTLRKVFELARKLRPTVIFLEDLDFYASQRGHGANEAALGELLAQMDGLKKNDGLIVIATTNDLAAIEPALKDRPSRFDAVFEVPMPNADCRRRLLERFLRKATIAAADLDAAALAAEGLSGAQLRELSVLVVQQAIVRGAVDDDGAARPSREDVEFAVTQMLGRRRGAMLGFHAQA